MSDELMVAILPPELFEEVESLMPGILSGEALLSSLRVAIIDSLEGG